MENLNITLRNPNNLSTGHCVDKSCVVITLDKWVNKEIKEITLISCQVQ